MAEYRVVSSTESNRATYFAACVARGGKSFRNTGFFAFDGELIKRIDVDFGASYQNGAFVRHQEN